VIIVPETSFSYNAHFSLSLPSTTIDTFPTFLIGPNGSGKTTLLKILGGFFKVSPPVKVKWQGTLRETRPIYFAYMPAKPTYDPNFTVKNYLMLSGNKRQLETIAKELELTKWLGRRMGTLSSGWLQRVFIARILLQDTPYVLMDEPTSFLDPEARKDLIESLSRHPEKHFVISSHDLAFLSSFGKSVIGLRDGNVVFRGSTIDFFERGIEDVFVTGYIM